MCFTIEPMISAGSHRDRTWPDNWTSVTVDGSRTAQFEHTLLITDEGCEILTARKEDSPGGKVEMPKEDGRNGAEKANGEKMDGMNGTVKVDGEKVDGRNGVEKADGVKVDGEGAKA